MRNHTRVVIGSGGSVHNKGWLHTEEEDLNLLRPEDWKRMFTPGAVQSILAEHVWEHLDYKEGIRAAVKTWQADR